MTYSDVEILLGTILIIECIFAFSNALSTAFYCIRMKAYEKAILSAKDCEKLVVRPPFRLFKKFSVSEVSENAENTPRK